jgi:hypothetical protein
MLRKSLNKKVLYYYVPVVLLLGGLGLLFNQIFILSFLILVPSVFLLQKNLTNLSVVVYIGITSVYSVYTRVKFNVDLNFHDGAAIILCASIFSYCCRHVNYIRSQPHFTRIFIFFLIFSLFGGVYFGNFYFGSGLLNFRLLGLTTNPNQLALYALCIFIIVRGSDISSVGKYFMQFICICTGALSGSDAFFVSVAVIFVLSLLWELWKINIVYSVVVACVLLLIAYFSIDLSKIELDTQSYERFNRWIYALKIYLEYPHVILFGLGPGGYGPGFDSTFLDYVDFSSGVEISGTEFHNSFLDFMTSFGILGLLVFYVFIKRNLGNLFITPEFYGLIAFSMFHLVYRHPIFWLALIFALQIKCNFRGSMQNFGACAPDVNACQASLIHKSTRA